MDLISREDAYNVLAKYYHPRQHEALKEALRRVPSARKKGEWINREREHIFTGVVRKTRECSVCGSGYFRWDLIYSIDAIPNFCPNCGADMRGEEDD